MTLERNLEIARAAERVASRIAGSNPSQPATARGEQTPPAPPRDTSSDLPGPRQGGRDGVEQFNRNVTIRPPQCHGTAREARCVASVGPGNDYAGGGVDASTDSAIPDARGGETASPANVADFTHDRLIPDRQQPPCNRDVYDMHVEEAYLNLRVALTAEKQIDAPPDVMRLLKLALCHLEDARKGKTDDPV